MPYPPTNSATKSTHNLSSIAQSSRVYQKQTPRVIGGRKPPQRTGRHRSPYPPKNELLVSPCIWVTDATHHVKVARYRVAIIQTLPGVNGLSHSPVGATPPSPSNVQQQRTQRNRVRNLPTIAQLCRFCLSGPPHAMGGKTIP